MIFEYDKYMLTPSLTDAMVTLHNNVGAALHLGTKVSHRQNSIRTASPITGVNVSAGF
jgi:hypothetical protein